MNALYSRIRDLEARVNYLSSMLANQSSSESGLGTKTAHREEFGKYKQHLRKICGIFSEKNKKLIEEAETLQQDLKSYKRKIRTSAKRLEWQDRYIDELLGLIKQRRLPDTSKSSSCNHYCL